MLTSQANIYELKSGTYLDSFLEAIVLGVEGDRKRRVNDATINMRAKINLAHVIVLLKKLILI